MGIYVCNIYVIGGSSHNFFVKMISRKKLYTQTLATFMSLWLGMAATMAFFCSSGNPCNSCSSDECSIDDPDLANFSLNQRTNQLAKSTSTKAWRMSALHKQYTKKFRANPSNSKLLAQARNTLNPTCFFRSVVIDSVKNAAGVVQTTNKTTMAIKTTTSMRSSGLCKPRRRVDARLGVPRKADILALVTLPLRDFPAGGAGVNVASTMVKAVVVVF